MKIICAGLSKTGTSSIASALKMLDFNIYYFWEHEAIHGDEWLDLYLKGKNPDFISMYQGVDGVTDLPAAFWYQEIFEAFPDAKVVLTVRDSEDVWLKSYVKQCDFDMNLEGCGFLQKLLIRSWSHRRYYALNDAMNSAAFGSLQEESTLLFKKKYREHNERVKAAIPKERLLVFNVKQGWKPLCEFLGCEIPEEDFPWLNAGQTLNSQKLAQRQRECATKVVMVLFILVSFFVLVCSFYLMHVKV